MTKQAHITSRPGHQVGDKVIGLCGKEWKVTVLWDDIPRDKPICRDCVDYALKAMTEADWVLELARRRSTTALLMLGRLDEELNPEGLTLDAIAERDAAHRQEQEARRARKAERKRAKATCTCTWTSPEVFTEDPDCPIHGHREQDAEIIEEGGSQTE